MHATLHAVHCMHQPDTHLLWAFSLLVLEHCGVNFIMISIMASSHGCFFLVRACIVVTSFGGNGRPVATGSSYPPGYAQRPPSLYRVEDSCDVVAANLVDQFQFAPDDDWNFLYVRDAGGSVTLTGHCERPAYYASVACT